MARKAPRKPKAQKIPRILPKIHLILNRKFNKIRTKKESKYQNKLNKKMRKG